MAKNLIACDFDGTVNSIDVGSSLVRTLLPEKWEYIHNAYRSGKLTNHQIYIDILAPALRNNDLNIANVISKFLRPARGFTDFYNFCGSGGYELIILSDGFDIYIREFLRKYSLDIRFYANKMIKSGGKYFLEFPNTNTGCSTCGTCKSEIIRGMKNKYDKITYVGDGDSDICPSLISSVFFGKKKVLKKIRQKAFDIKTPQFYFYDFKHLENLFKKAGNYRAVIFDLDGTIVDGFDIIYESFNHSLVKLGLKPVPTHKIRKVIGPALSEGFRCLVPDYLVDDGVREYRAYYRERYLERNELFAGMRETLAMLKDSGILVGMITNKKGIFAEELLEYLKLAKYFDFIRGAEEGYLPKPDGAMIDAVAAQYNLEKSEIIYVGDSSIDGSFARNSGVDFIAVGMGLGKEDELYRYKPVSYCATVEELQRVLLYLASSLRC
jgi:2-hydroxy-3-keto-5-methylthiopentenyl-1-phosphate phosphatase